MDQHVLISHWLPIVTFCPVNKLPDFLYITLGFENEFVELYEVRKRMRKLISGKLMFMEDVVLALASEFKNASYIKVALMTNRHIVELK